jgi:acetyl-CoA decarbonylase/synthase complex subunit epsilon
LDGKGQYDVVIFMGIFYKFASAMFSTLKNFNRDNKRVSIDRYYHVNADMTFGNLAFDQEKYHEAVDEVIGKLTA